MAFHESNHYTNLDKASQWNMSHYVKLIIVWHPYKALFSLSYIYESDISNAIKEQLKDGVSDATKADGLINGMWKAAMLSVGGWAPSTVGALDTPNSCSQESMSASVGSVQSTEIIGTYHHSNISLSSI